MAKSKDGKNIVLIGMPGCGKSYIGQILADQTGMCFIDMDAVIEKEEQISISEIFSKYGEKYFRELEMKKAAELSVSSSAIISTGGGVILFPENIENLKANGVVFFIDRKISLIISSSDMADRPLLKNDSEINLKKLYDNRINLYRSYADYIVQNNAGPYEAAEEIMRRFTK